MYNKKLFPHRLLLGLLLCLSWFIFSSSAYAGICEETTVRYTAPAGGMVFNVDISDSPGYSFVKNPTGSYLQSVGFTFPLPQNIVTFTVPASQRYYAYVPGNSEVSVCRQTLQQPHGFQFAKWPGNTVINSSPLTLPSGEVYSGNPNAPVANTSPTCDDLNWAISQGLNVDYITQLNVCALPSDVDYAKTCTTHSTSATQNGMVVQVIPLDVPWTPGSGIPEDVPYAIYDDPSNIWLTQTAGFSFPAPPPVGAITVSNSAQGTFYYVPPNSLVSVCTEGQNVSIEPIHLSSHKPICNINGVEYAYSGNPFDFIGDGYSPATACEEFNCVSNAGQTPIWVDSNGPNFADAHYSACNQGVFELETILNQKHQRLVNFMNFTSTPANVVENFLKFSNKYLDGSSPDYIGNTPDGHKDAQGIHDVIQSCRPILPRWTANSFSGRIKNLLEDRWVLANAYPHNISPEPSILVHQAMMRMVSAMTSHPSLTQNTWRLRELVVALQRGDFTGTVSQLLNNSGMDLNSPLASALLSGAASNSYYWPSFNAGEEVHFIDFNTSDNLGALWEDMRGIINYCSVVGKQMSVFNDLANGSGSSIDLPDWTPQVNHSSPEHGTDLASIEEQFAPISQCPLAAQSAQALNGWQLASERLLDHEALELNYLGSGNVDEYVIFRDRATELLEAMHEQERNFWTTTISAATTMLGAYENTPASEVLALLKEYREKVLDSASADEIQTLDNLIDTLSLTPQESVAWLLQALAVLGINPIAEDDDTINPIHMLTLACQLQSAIDTAENYEDDNGGGGGYIPHKPTNNWPVYTGEDCEMFSVKNLGGGKYNKGKNIGGKNTGGKPFQQVLNTNNCDEEQEDPYVSEQWYLNDEDAGINLPEEEVPLNRKILIGMVDHGINTNHLDLIPNLWNNDCEVADDGIACEVADDGIDNDGNGCIDDIYGCNVTKMNGDVHSDLVTNVDYQFHGTQVAGVIIAEAKNGVGIQGINPDATLITASVEGGAIDDFLRESVDYLIKNGVHIVNLSLVVSQTTNLSEILGVMTDNPNVLFVVASGNKNKDLEYTAPFGRRAVAPIAPLIPYETPWINDLPNLIVVSATDKNTIREGNYGAQSVHLSAPGVDIITTNAGIDGVATESGTSLAAPMVSGAASLLMQTYPDLTAAQVKSRLLSSVRELSNSSHVTVTGGTLDIGTAMENDSDSHLHMTPQFQLVDVIPGRQNNQFPIIFSNTGHSADAGGLSLGSLTPEISFSTSLDIVGPGDKTVVDAYIDATSLTPFTEFNTVLGISNTETMNVQIRASGIEAEILPVPAGLAPYQTGKEVLSFDGTHILASSGSGESKSLAVYRKSVNDNSYTQLQTLPCSNPCVAGMQGDIIMVHNNSQIGAIDIYRFDSLLGHFFYQDNIVLPNIQSIKAIEVGDNFAAVSANSQQNEARAYLLNKQGLVWNEDTYISPTPIQGYNFESYGYHMDINGEYLAIAGSRKKSLFSEYEADIVELYRIQAVGGGNMEVSSLPHLSLSTAKDSFNSTSKVRIDLAGDKMVAVRGAGDERKLAIYRIPSAINEYWQLLGKYSMRDREQQLDLSPRELHDDIIYSVATDGENIAVGISGDSRFGYELDADLNRRGAGVVLLFKVLENQEPGGEAQYEIVTSGSILAASNLQPGDALGWRLSDVVNGELIVSRPNSESSTSPDEQNTGDIIRYVLP